MHRPFLSFLIIAATAAAYGQNAPTNLNRGFSSKAPAVATADELAQGDLWVMEVEFKPLRLIRIETTNPETGQKQSELVWYLVYRAQNKPLAAPPRETDRTPVNNYDPPPGPSLLIPEFELITDDDNVQTVHRDVLLPEAQAAIIAREMRGSDANRTLKNSVQVVQPIPPADGTAEPIYGVAMWKGIDPATDNFRVFASGFSNGYQEVPGPNGQPLIRRREIMLDYWGPGDEFELRETEFRLRSEPRWVYRADDAKPIDAVEDAVPDTSVESTPAS